MAGNNVPIRVCVAFAIVVAVSGAPSFAGVSNGADIPAGLGKAGGTPKSTDWLQLAYNKSSRNKSKREKQAVPSRAGEPPAQSGNSRAASSQLVAGLARGVHNLIPEWPATRNIAQRSTAKGTSSSIPVAQSAEPGQPADASKLTWSDGEIIAALRQCLSLLAPQGVEIEPADPMRNGACGDAAPVRLRSAGTKDRVRFEPPVEVNCALAAKLATWIDNDLQPAARETFSAPVTKITGASGYSCRNRYGLPNAPLSEHATGNAIDIPAFTLANGKSIRLASGWGPTARDIAAQAAAAAKATAAKPEEGQKADAAKRVPSVIPDPADDAGTRPVVDEAVSAGASQKPKNKKVASLKPGPIPKIGVKLEADELPPIVPSSAGPSAASLPVEGRFLRRLYKVSCERFGTVLGPEANEAHRDHFHLDIKTRRKKAYCQ